MLQQAVEFRGVAEGDVDDLVARMRSQDVAEVLAAGMQPRVALKQSIAASTWCRTVLVAGKLVAVVGLAPHGTVLDPRAAPWLLGTDDVPRHARILVRQARPYIRAMLGMYPHLVNVVHAENTHALRFLRGMGFTVHETPVQLPTGAVFHVFEMRA